jgi:signal recognition particle GTPase
MQGEFTLDDFRKQMMLIADGRLVRWARDTAPRPSALADALDSEDKSVHPAFLGIIDAMTNAERSNSRLIDAARQARIAHGAGCQPAQVCDLIRQFEAMASVMAAMKGKGLRERIDYFDPPQLNERPRRVDPANEEPGTPDDHDIPPTEA